MNFEWEESKNQLNVKKHGISFEHAAYVFTDPFRKEAYDVEHSDSEQDRTIAIGIAKGRLLFVSFTEPDPETVRIISSRKADTHERRFYYGNS